VREEGLSACVLLLLVLRESAILILLSIQFGAAHGW
jgi:hypothetical protein